MKKTKFIRAATFFASFAFIIGLALFLAGCVNPSAAQIKTFSDACVLTVSNTAGAFQLTQDDYHKRQISELVLKYGTNANDYALEPFFTPQELQIRVAVLQGLEIYAADLSTLVGNSALTNLDLDTTKIGTGLIAIDTNLVQDSFMKSEPVSSQDLEIFTTAINALGHWIISYKQEKAAKQAISEMQPSVDKICGLLLKDFASLESEIDSDNQRTFQAEDSFIQKYFAAYENNPSSLRLAVENAASLYQERQDDHDLLEEMKTSVSKMQSTHAVLDQVYSKDSSNINAMIGEFSEEARRVNAYYNSLKTAN